MRVYISCSGVILASRYLHLSLKILFDSIVFQILINLWQPVGIALWEISFINDPPYMLHFIIHIISWAIFYGTNLMVDLPDLIGLNQAIEFTQKCLYSHAFILISDYSAVLKLKILSTDCPRMCEQGGEVSRIDNNDRESTSYGNVAFDCNPVISSVHEVRVI